jgi:Fe-S-cluster containining protein
METTQTPVDLDPFKSIVSRITHEKLDTLRMSATILVTLQEIMEFVQGVVVQLEKSNHSPKAACGSGCSYCCHSQINIIPVEALLIFSLIETSFTPREIRELKIKIQDNHLLTTGKTFAEKVAVKDQTPCVFLVETGQCRIYSARPFICRSWHSFDKDACESAFVSGNPDAGMEVFEARNYMFSTARKVFQDLSLEMKMETGIYKMPDAIGHCFLNSTPLTSWLSGQSVFKPS